MFSLKTFLSPISPFLSFLSLTISSSLSLLPLSSAETCALLTYQLLIPLYAPPSPLSVLFQTLTTWSGNTTLPYPLPLIYMPRFLSAALALLTPVSG
ncbi:hypothetical protein FKM82_027928 [Ascaphus truei]